MTVTDVPAPPADTETGRFGWLGRTGWYPLAILCGLTMVDELDRSAFILLLPEIRDHFGLDNTGILSVVAVAGAAALLLTVPIAQLADRSDRVRIALIGAAAFAAFSLGTGLVFTVWLLVTVRCGTAMGQAVVFPTHNSLLADYYPIESRPKVYALHRAGNSVGVIVGLLTAAALASVFDWRAPFLVFAVPTLVLVVAGLRLRDPGRGHFEREAAQLDGAIGADEPPPSYAEAVRMVWTIASLRRIFAALPFLAASIVGFASLASLQYAETFGLSEVRRAWVNVPVQLLELGGVLIGARLTTRAFTTAASGIFRVLAMASVAAAVLAAVFAGAPNVVVAVTAHALIASTLVIVGPGVLASLSLAVPPRARAIGFSIGALWVLPGLLVIPFVGWVGDHLGFRWGLLMLTPVFLIGGLLISSVGSLIDGDIDQVWTGAATRAQMIADRAAGRLPLLSVRGLDVSYGDVQVLFGVDLDVAEGEIIALLGTNGAGKSTLLRAITGVAPAGRGAVVFDGRDITHTPPEEIATHGIATVPGGQGVFGGLSVADNLRAAGWLLRGDPDKRSARVEAALDLFPVLRQRLDDPATELSGGQQQMLALAMAFLSRPKLLMVDELSLGLAPVVVDQLLDVVRDLRDQGTTIVLVEQSVNVALTVADTAYFMEKGEIRFHGPTSELLERPTSCVRSSSRARPPPSRRRPPRRRPGRSPATVPPPTQIALTGRPSPSTASRWPSVASGPSMTCPSPSPRARWSGSSGRTERARRPCSTWSLATSARRRDGCTSATRTSRASRLTNVPTSGSGAASRTRGCSPRSPSRRRCSSLSNDGSTCATPSTPPCAYPPTSPAKRRPATASPSSSSCSAWTPSAPSSWASSPPARAGSSTSVASWPTGRLWSCSTSRPRGSRSGKPRPSAPCWSASVTPSTPAWW